MFQYIVFSLIFLSISFTIIFYLYTRRKKINSLKEESYGIPDEIVPVSMGKHTVWLRNCEVENFNSQPRKMRLFIAKKFERKVKKGLLIPIKENEKIIGFVTREEYNKKTNERGR